ncbi:MAG: hypothetical protein ABGX16_14225 [Pirellulales bacterium]
MPMRQFIQSMTVLAAWTMVGHTCPTVASEQFDAALQSLRRVGAGTVSQSEIQHAWNIVAQGKADQITTILAAMDDIGPLAENWLRAAVDTIAERELRNSKRLPKEELRQFVIDLSNPSRARRTAFEWLIQIDPAARDRLLPKMVEDSSLELRHDAIAQLIVEAEKAANDDLKRAHYRRSFTAARDLTQTVQCVKSLEKLGDSQDLEKHFGYVTEWTMIGPFDNTQGAGFDKIFPPEHKLDFAKQYQGKHDLVRWQSYRSEFQRLEKIGLVDLNEILIEAKGVTAYLAVTFNSAKKQKVQCRYETVNATKLWINGELLIRKNIYHMGGEFDQYISPATFLPGKNTILLKICQNEQTESWARPWNFRFRITDVLGGGHWPIAVSP